MGKKGRAQRPVCASTYADGWMTITPDIKCEVWQIYYN